mmetsp:Transcript_10535/g.18625  ORF Transcript_10535/g.18625 Transcript_10535/m.18625 type:complete len:529 (-) Transcript_10535:1441-3027(-)
MEGFVPLGANDVELAREYDEEDWDGEYDASWDSFGEKPISGVAKGVALQPREHAHSMLEKKINLSQRAANDVKRGEKKQAGQNRHQGRDDRATTEQVMDPRTRLIIFKMLSRGTFEEINGCISTGKEANVYHAVTKEGVDLAVKVFKTSILVFKDRDKYVTGEHRFKGGYGKGNPRKMVKMWAEKEMRNLKRLHTAGIMCPNPQMLRTHVLVMDFIGSNGWPAPRLKDAVLSSSRVRSAYVQCLKILRRMFQLCKLVHGDYSEYNLLYFEGTIYVIDVSQSVEMDHPRALEFLRLDIENTNAFFARKGLSTMNLTQAFKFIIDRSFDCSEEAMDEALDRIQNEIENAVDNVDADMALVEQRVFLKSFIPTSLSQVADFENDATRLEGDRDRQLARIMTAMHHHGTPQNHSKASPNMTGEASNTEPGPAQAEGSDQAKEAEGEADAEGEEDAEYDEQNGDESEEDQFDENGKRIRRSHRDNFFRLRTSDKDERKAHKKQLKEEKREKRKEKVPKHVKKRHSKVAKQSSR